MSEENKGYNPFKYGKEQKQNTASDEAFKREVASNEKMQADMVKRELGISEQGSKYVGDKTASEMDTRGEQSAAQEKQVNVAQEISSAIQALRVDSFDPAIGKEKATQEFQARMDSLDFDVDSLPPAVVREMKKTNLFPALKDDE